MGKLRKKLSDVHDKIFVCFFLYINKKKLLQFILIGLLVYILASVFGIRGTPYLLFIVLLRGCADLQFCRASSGKSEALLIIPKKPICRPSLDLVKLKVKLKFWWLHSRNMRALCKISKSSSSQTIYHDLLKSWRNTWNKQTKTCTRAIFMSMTKFF